MIKLILEIKEKDSQNLKTIKAIGSEIKVKEVGIMATEGEKEICEILKKRINVDKKLQFETENEKMKKILNMLEDLV